MESLKRLVEKQQAGTNSLKLHSEPQRGLVINERGETHISLYKGELTAPIITKCLAKIKAAFPALPPEFLTILSDRIIEKEFCDERLIDAVNHVIDTCLYPTPSIGQFASFDKKRRLYTYAEMCDKVHEAGGVASVWDAYEEMKIKGTRFWYSKAETHLR